jgi:predicted RNA-binding protein associated with RNAse of E/G family
VQRFEQRLVHRDAACVVTLLEATPLARPMRIDGVVALEPGAPAVWFTFPGAWHDIGRFHDARGHFTGLYANVLTPVEGLAALEWRTTDLFLDIWLPASGGPPTLLDEAELADAVAGGLDIGLADAARREAARLLDAAAAGSWPPAVVHEWTLERALHVARRGTWRADPV